MNVSNGSCEYFYDEEYDVAAHEGTYNQPFLTQVNNSYFSSINNNHLKHDFLTTSRLWSQCLLEDSGNNNYHESCEDLESNPIFKCVSSDNIIDCSRYSLSEKLPFLNQTGDNSFNYRLYFDKRESINVKEVFDIKKQFAKRYNNNRNFIDSGKCSAATSDSLIHPYKQYRNELANSENNLHETSIENHNEKSVISTRKKSSKQLWRKLKDAFSSKKVSWKKMVDDDRSTRFGRSYSSPSLFNVNSFSNDKCYKNNRFSTTVVELYNLLIDLCNEPNNIQFSEKSLDNDKVKIDRLRGQDVSCQCPELISNSKRVSRKPRRNINVNYPGLGKIKLPHQLQTSVSHLIGTDVFENLKFLENALETNQKHSKRGNSENRIRGRAGKLDNDNLKKNHALERCSSESRHTYDFQNVIKNDVQKCITLIEDSSTLNVIEENKSLSFSDLRPIPRNWGLSKGDQILAVFEFPSRTSIEPKVIEYDEESNSRIGGLVSTTIAAIKLVAESVSSVQDLGAICDRFVRCKDSNRQSTCNLLLAVDTILALISDGLSVDSLRLKKTTQPVTLPATKMTLRMWMFFEESCRSNLIKDASHKLAFANLLKQVKQICGNTIPDQRSKEWLAQLKLQIFIVIAIKNNILHIWLRAVVVNDTILHRFFASCSFLQQARTSYSNALSAVVVEIRRLSTPGSSKIYNVSKAIKGKGARAAPVHQISNSSSDNSISKSRIPRPSQKLCK